MNTNTKHIVIGLVLLAALIVAMAVFKGAEFSTPVGNPESAPMGKLPAGSLPPALAPEIVGMTWVWTETVLADGSVIMPKKTDAFTLTLSSDGKVTGTTDCNGFGGDFNRASDGVIAFGSMTSTLMYCEGSQESEFTGNIANATRVTYDGEGNMILVMKDSAGLIYFKKQ